MRYSPQTVAPAFGAGEQSPESGLVQFHVPDHETVLRAKTQRAEKKAEAPSIFDHSLGREAQRAIEAEDPQPTQWWAQVHAAKKPSASVVEGVAVAVPQHSPFERQMRGS